MTNKPPVAVVLASYNGADFISQQLDSILVQSWPCDVYIFDDASTDNTVEVIKDRYLHYDNFFLTVNDKNIGYVKNFEQGINKVRALGASYIALSDQDDVWKPNKLEQMMTALLADQSGKPLLAFSDLHMVDKNLVTMHQSYLNYRNYSPRRLNSPYLLSVALGQNGVMGNTILMNSDLVEQVLPFPSFLHSHDYWISLIAQLYGKCLFIPEALVDYRIHEDNTSNSAKALFSVGGRGSLWGKIKQRNYQLPYKEDSRDKTIIELLRKDEERQDTSEKSALSESDKETMVGFLGYLQLNKPRWFIAYWMLKNRFIRKGWKHKLRFLFRVMTTRRYL